MSISPRHRAISPPTPAPSPQPDLHTSIRLANNAAAVAASSSSAIVPHALVVDPQDPSQLLKHLSLVLPQYTQSARFRLVSEFADLFSVRELAHLSSVITPRLKVDFMSALPIEVSLNILSFIDDPKTLARASCVSRFWRSLVNDEHTWKVMCLKHKYRRRGSSNAHLHSLDDRLMRSITTPLLASSLSTPRITTAALSSIAGPSTALSASHTQRGVASSSSLGVVLEQPLARAATFSDYGEDAEEFNDEDDAAVLASLYQRYRDRGLDPSNALHELRTLHDLYLSKQDGAHGSLNESMSGADLAFYAQLEEIVEEESRARYGDEPASFDPVALHASPRTVPSAASPSRSRSLALPTETSVPPASASAHLGWLSAGPATTPASLPLRAAAPLSSPPQAPPVSLHALSAQYRSDGGLLDRLHGWQQQLTPATAAAAFTTPRPHDANAADLLEANRVQDALDEAMDMDEQDDLVSNIPSSSSHAAQQAPIGRPPNAPPLASLPHHDSPTGRFSASAASPSTNVQAATRVDAGTSRLVPGPRESRRSPAHRNAILEPRPTRRSSTSATADRDDPAAVAGLNLVGTSSLPPSAQHPSSQAGPSRYAPSSTTATHLHRHRSAKLPFSYRTHFKMAYLTESNWRKGGRLQTQHVSADAGHVVTSLAIDSEWIVVGMANSKIHVFSAETGLYAHTLLGHESGVWCLTLISRTGKGKKSSTSAASERAKGKMVVTDPEDGNGGKPYQAAADGDLRLVHHDPRPDAADVLLSPSVMSAELTEEDALSGRRLSASASSTPVSGKARQTYGHGETLQWFHKARRALRRQQSARKAAAAVAASASATGEDSFSNALLLDAYDQSTGGGDSDPDLSIRSEGPSFVHHALRSSKEKSEHENARAIAEAEAGAIRDAVMADGTGQIPPELAERFRRDGETVASAAGTTAAAAASTGDAGAAPKRERTRSASTSAMGSMPGLAAASLTGNAAGMGNPCSSVLGYGNTDAIVISGGCDRDVRVWDLRTGECKHILRGHTSTVRCLKVLDGKPIAVSGSRDSTLRVWNVETGEQVHLLAGHQHSVRCIEVAGNQVASGSYDGTCRIWDLDTGRCLHTLRGHIHYIYAVAFDGKRVATGSLDSTVRVWSAETGECLALFQGHTSLVGQLQLLDNTLVTGGSDGRVIVFSLKTYECLHRLCAHDNSVTCLQFDDRYIITGGNDGRVKLWDFNTGKFIREVCEPCEAVWKRQGSGAQLCPGSPTSQVLFRSRRCLSFLALHWP
ncbi:WD40 repeat [Kalmanozyma brasiliensis GHG001]|uniref:WD40 repeat n=1 Tax=Kalmanozyma brasiliensis (strain GHG001) TaxID=1365824 RepID=UPI0028682D89|nr:WD40 repeat [Kalmanozyma brasiliensis GHG001]EST07268.2 WD40 repeat [Kalmanozyma brasiliensis GHG001]